jgi:hypothetical protein
VTSWSHWRLGRLWVEIVLAVVVGVAAFVVAALVSTAARSHVPGVLFGLLLLLAVLAVARFAGILYALPVGVVTIEAFDWYFLPPLRQQCGDRAGARPVPGDGGYCRRGGDSGWPPRGRVREGTGRAGRGAGGAAWRVATLVAQGAQTGESSPLLLTRLLR